jgi:hypothetical protein
VPAVHDLRPAINGIGKEQGKFFYVPTVPGSAGSSRHLSAGVFGWSDHARKSIALMVRHAGQRTHKNQ